MLIGQTPVSHKKEQCGEANHRKIQDGNVSRAVKMSAKEQRVSLSSPEVLLSLM